MSFGAFMKGMQGGMSTMQDLRRQRQLDDIYDVALTESEYDLANRERARERAGLPPIARRKSSQTFLGRLSDKLDPVMARWMEGVGRGTGTIESPTASALPVAEEFSPENYQYQFEEEPIFLADGGELTLEEKTKLRKFELLRNQGGANYAIPEEAPEPEPETKTKTKGKAAASPKPSSEPAPPRDFTRGREVPSRLNEVDPNKLSVVEDAGTKTGATPRRPLTEAEHAELRARARAAYGGKPDIRPVQYASAENQKTIDRANKLPLTQGKSAIPESPPSKSSRWKPKGYGLDIRAREGAGMLRRGAAGVARVAARGAVPLSIAGAMQGGMRAAGEDVNSDAARQLQVGEEPNWYDPLVDPKFYGEMGLRAVNAGKGALAGALNPFGIFGGTDADKEASAPPTSTIPALASTAHAAPAAAPAIGGSTRRQQAVPTAAPTEADPFAGFDVTKVQAADIPNFSNQDWVSFREEAIKDYVSAGMSYGEAWEKVDQQVVATQQRGFLHFGSQARQLLAAGNLRGAASAVRAAFQYMPTTTDLQVGEYNGHLVAFTTDEDTKQPVGRPVPIDVELLDSVLMNFADRNNWVAHAQDNRKLDQADRELGQGDRRLGILERANEIEALKAQAMALSGAGMGGMRLSDADRHTQLWQDQALNMLNQLGIQDPAMERALASVMSAWYVAEGGADRPEEIVERVAALAQTEEGRARIVAVATKLSGG